MKKLFLILSLTLCAILCFNIPEAKAIGNTSCIFIYEGPQKALAMGSNARTEIKAGETYTIYYYKSTDPFSSTPAPTAVSWARIDQIGDSPYCWSSYEYSYSQIVFTTPTSDKPYSIRFIVRTSNGGTYEKTYTVNP